MTKNAPNRNKLDLNSIHKKAIVSNRAKKAFSNFISGFAFRKWQNLFIS